MQLLLWVFWLNLLLLHGNNCETTEATQENVTYPDHESNNGSEINELQQITYDDIVDKLKNLKKNLTDNLPKITHDEIAPPRGSGIIVKNKTNHWEIVTWVRFQYI